MAKQTLMTDILLPAKGLRSRALIFLMEEEDKTAEGLVKKYDTRSLSRVIGVGPKTAGYIIGCLEKAGFNIRESKPISRKASERYGEERTKQTILDSLTELSTKHPHAYFTASSIKESAEDRATGYLKQEGMGFVEACREAGKIFRYPCVNNMLTEGGVLENSVESAGVFVGGRNPVKNIYRLKQTQGEL